MSTKIARKGLGLLVAGAVSLGLGVSLAPAADAAPRKGDTWVDCSGPKLCTKYYSRAKTAEFDENLSRAALANPWVYVAAGACGAIGALVGMGGTPVAAAAAAGVAGAACGGAASTVTSKQLGGVDKAASAAVAANGCLQVAWPKNKKGTSKWSYTTHSGYCWDE